MVKKTDEICGTPRPELPQMRQWRDLRKFAEELRKRTEEIAEANGTSAARFPLFRGPRGGLRWPVAEVAEAVRKRTEAPPEDADRQRDCWGIPTSTGRFAHRYKPFIDKVKRSTMA